MSSEITFHNNLAFICLSKYLIKSYSSDTAAPSVLNICVDRGTLLFYSPDVAVGGDVIRHILCKITELDCDQILLL